MLKWGCGGTGRAGVAMPLKNLGGLAPSLRELSAKLTEGVFPGQMTVTGQLPPPPSETHGIRKV